MDAVGRMEKKSRRPGTSHCRRDLLPDQAGLSHPGHDDLAFALKKEVDGLVKLIVQSIDERLDGAGFDRQDPSPFGEAATVRLGRRLRGVSGLQFFGFAASHIRITRSRSDLS